MKKIAILGLTGSIGKTALNALEAYKDTVLLVAGSVNTNISCALEICKNHSIPALCVTGNISVNERALDNDAKRTSPASASIIQTSAPATGDALNHEKPRIFRSINELLHSSRPDIVLNGIAGSAGLSASISVIESGAKLALANKETVVLGGSAFFDFVREHNGEVIPVDSEHSAIDELLTVHGRENVNKLIITASGGPFLKRTRTEIRDIQPKEAIKHPTWNMGPKISIDSATLANKGLEVIEAHYLFGFCADKIRVVIHPQSIVHSMVQTISGQVYAQMSRPDMAGPIMRALLERNFTAEVSAPPDFSALDLNFSEPDYERFPLLKLAFECVKNDGPYPIVYNIADEVAVEEYIKGKIRFTDIDAFVSNALSKNWEAVPGDVSLIPAYLKLVRDKLIEERR